MAFGSIESGIKKLNIKTVPPAISRIISIISIVVRPRAASQIKFSDHIFMSKPPPPLPFTTTRSWGCLPLRLRPPSPAWADCPGRLRKKVWVWRLDQLSLPPSPGRRIILPSNKMKITRAWWFTIVAGTHNGLGRVSHNNGGVGMHLA